MPLKLPSEMQQLSFPTIHGQGFSGHTKEKWYKRSI
jgi:hypothetical protein